jgi:hypothetical protein
MRKKRFSWDDYQIGNFLKHMDEGVNNVPFLNRQYKWDYNRILEYMETLFDARLNGCITLWGINENNKYKPSCQINSDNKNLKNLILDGGNRTRSLWSLRYNKAIPGAKGYLGTQGVRIAFNPLTGEFRKATDRNLKEKGWLHNFSVIWNIEDPADMYDHVRGLTKEFIAENYDDGMFKNLSEDQTELIRKNIENLVEIIFLDFHFAYLPPYITLVEALQTFRDINSSGVKVNTIDALLSMIFGNAEETGHKIKDFDARNNECVEQDKSNVRLTAEDILVVALGIRGKDLHKTIKLMSIYENCSKEEFDYLVDLVLDEYTFKDFENNVVKRSGYIGVKTGNMVFPGVYTLFLDAIHQHKFSSEDIHGIFRQLFFVVGMMPKRFSGNLTDNLNKLLKKLKKAENLEEYKKIFLTNLADFIKANTLNLKDELLADTYKGSKYIHLLKSVAILNDTKLLFTNNYVRNNLDLLHAHHLHPLNYAFYPEEIDTDLLNSIMNIGFTSRNKNLKISNNDIASYFSPAILEHKEDSKRQMELHCLDDSWSNGMSSSSDLLHKLETRAKKYEDLIIKTIKSLDK